MKLSEMVAKDIYDILDNTNNGGMRYDYSDNNVGVRNIKEKEKEVMKMESGLNEVVTALGSAIAGVYCLVKTIINLVKKVRK